MKRRVVITGMGIASPLGSTLESAFGRLKKYKNCVQHWEKLDEYERLNTNLGAFVSGFEIPEHFTRKVMRTMGKVSVMAVVTAEQALKEAGLSGDECVSQAGVSYGSSTGSLDAVLDFYSMCIDKKVKLLNSGSYIKMMPQTAAVNISLYFRTHGRLIATSTACTSGSMGIGYAYEAIKDGYQDIMIAGGAEEIHPTQVGVFDTLYATSSKNDTPKLTPSPFDKDRDGLVIGEGAGTVILEEYERAKARGAVIFAEITGFATNTDGTHITNPNKDMMAEVMRKSLQDAGLKPEDIGYINAHGTGTVNGDIAESQGDTLMLVNQLDEADRSFTTNDPNKIYNLSDDIGSTASGTFTVAGAADGAGNLSTIDMNRYTGFVLDNEGTTLNISNIKFQNLNFADGSLINITEKGGIANLNNVIIEVSNSLNAITNAGSLNMTGGKVILNSGIAGDGITSVTGGADVLLSNGAHIEQSNIFVTDGSLTVDDRSVLESILAIGEKGSVTTAVDGITSDVDNDGNITFTEGDLEYNISGEGTLSVSSVTVFFFLRTFRYRYIP